MESLQGRGKQEDLAQQYIQTIKYRNLVIDLGNGVKTNAQLTYPALGKGPFPGVLLIHGSGTFDKNETLGRFWQSQLYFVLRLLSLRQH